MSGVIQTQLRKKSDGLGKTRICNTLERPASVQALVGILRTVKNFSKPACGVRGRGPKNEAGWRWWRRSAEIAQER